MAKPDQEKIDKALKKTQQAEEKIAEFRAKLNDSDNPPTEEQIREYEQAINRLVAYLEQITGGSPTVTSPV